MNKKKSLKIVVVLLVIIIIAGGVFLLVENKKDNFNNKVVDVNVEKVKKYTENITNFNIEEAVKNKGFISEDEALRIMSVSTVSRNDKQIEMKEYIKTVDSMQIELIENNNNNWELEIGDVESKGTYWKIILIKSSSSYIEHAQFNIDYYTGEILYGKVTVQLNVD